MAGHRLQTEAGHDAIGVGRNSEIRHTRVNSVREKIDPRSIHPSWPGSGHDDRAKSQQKQLLV
jgi:hypothetical protein